MPESAIDKHRNLEPSPNQVWSTSHVSLVASPAAYATCVKRAAQRHLRPRVACTNCGHDAGALLWCACVHRGTVTSLARSRPL